MDLLGWPAEVWALAAAASLVAGVVRGYTGFGFALILVTTVSVLAAPGEIVAFSGVVDIFASLRMLPHVHRDVDRRGCLLMLAGALPAIPIGALALAGFSEDAMRLAIGVAVLAATLAIAAGIGLRRVPGTGLKLATGVTMGLMSGAAGIPGPPVILLYLSSPLPAATLRATAVAVFLAVDLIALVTMTAYGLVTADVLLHCLVLAPLVEGAVYLGRRLYGTADETSVKRAALALLAVMALVAIIRATLG
ncbi:sulfite exporter TauE/SafE family protein [Thalassobaculum sp.]|uniref:sulfite exporter TauE/SafE family protein n=1 Tax=Thalassobaculum sp. TaxID=2022740 RepID=UPI0032EE0A64